MLFSMGNGEGTRSGDILRFRFILLLFLIVGYSNIVLFFFIRPVIDIRRVLNKDIVRINIFIYV